jgi:hypothetical protein
MNEGADVKARRPESPEGKIAKETKLRKKGWMWLELQAAKKKCQPRMGSDGRGWSGLASERFGWLEWPTEAGQSARRPV